MGLANVFKKAAKTTVHIFAKDNGNSTYKSLDKGKGYGDLEEDDGLGIEIDSGSGYEKIEVVCNCSYDPITDTVQRLFSEYYIPIAYDAIEDSAPFGHDFIQTHLIAFIACSDLPVVPKQGDVIIDYNGVSYIIDNDLATRDQYEAVYTIYLKMVPEDV